MDNCPVLPGKILSHVIVGRNLSQLDGFKFNSSKPGSFNHHRTKLGNILKATLNKNNKKHVPGEYKEHERN